MRDIGHQSYVLIRFGVANNTRRQIMNNKTNNEAIVSDFKASKMWHAQFSVVIGLMPPVRGIIHYCAFIMLQVPHSVHMLHILLDGIESGWRRQDHINVSHQTTLIKI